MKARRHNKHSQRKQIKEKKNSEKRETLVVNTRTIVFTDCIESRCASTCGCNLRLGIYWLHNDRKQVTKITSHYLPEVR